MDSRQPRATPPALPSARHPYATRAYAEALAAAGALPPIDVPEWATYVLARPIDGGGEDAAGPYPRTPLFPAADLSAGLERLRLAGLISVVVVSDPLSGADGASLARAFDPCRPLKTHHLVDRAAWSALRAGQTPSA